MDNTKKIGMIKNRVIIQNYVNAFYFSHKNISDDEKIVLNFDVLEKISLSYAYSECKSAKRGKKSKRSPDIENKINKIFSFAFSTGDLKKDVALNAFKELFKILYENDSSGNKFCIPPEYHDENKRKCIALFQYEKPVKRIVAFSGKTDALCKALMPLSPTKNYYKSFLKIADALDASLATIHCKIKRYRFGKKAKDTSIESYESLDEILPAVIDEHYRDHHTCCERKILTYIDLSDNTNICGTMCVKFPPCEDCTLAIAEKTIYKNAQIKMHILLK